MNIRPLQAGDWALITGASSGMGKAFAQRLAAQGIHLFLVALEKDLLESLAQQLDSQHRICVISYALDLTQQESIQKIRFEIETKKLQISLLINAAGFGYFGEFDLMPEAQVRSMIQLNAIALAELSRFILPRLQSQNRGAIINITSVAGFLPYPFAAVYSATKSFVRILTQALWAENQNKKIKIMLLCPGYTKSNFEKVSTEPDTVHLFPGENPDDIADKALAHLNQSSCTYFTKFSHPFKILAAKLLTLKVFAEFLRLLLRKGRQR